MKAEEKHAIFEIVRISLETEYDEPAQIELAMERFKRKKPLPETIFGKRYLERLEKLSYGDKKEDTCILCKNNIAGNYVICGECIGNILPIMQAADKAAEEEVKKAASDSRSPARIAESLKQRINEIQTENGMEIAQVGIRQMGSFHTIFFDTDRFVMTSLFDNTKIGELLICHINHKSVEASVEIVAQEWAELIGKILIELMMPELTVSRINELYEVTVENKGPYFYNGLYFEGGPVNNRFAFTVGTESYETEIATNVERLGPKDDFRGFDLMEIFEWIDWEDFLSKFKDVEDYGDELILDNEIKIIRSEGQVMEVCLRGIGGYQLAGCFYGQRESAARRIMEKRCTNVYKDSSSGYKSRYKYKGKYVLGRKNYRIEASIFCGYVNEIKMSRRQE